MPSRTAKLLSFGLGVLAAGLVAALLIVLLGDNEPSEPVAGARPGVACTLIGCSSGIDVRVTRLAAGAPEARVLRLCEDDACAETVMRRETYPAVRLSMQFEGPTDVSPRLTILDGDGVALITSQTKAAVDRRYPNGEECDDGTCINVALVYDVPSDTWRSDPNDVDSGAGGGSPGPRRIAP